MKRSFVLLGVAVLLCTSCKKDPPETCSDGIENQDEFAMDCGGVCNPCPIEYPETGDWGQNVLYGNDTLHLSVGIYSFRATVAIGSSLKVIANLVSGNIWLYGTNNGWSAGTPTSSQSFDVDKPGTAELQFKLENGSGVIVLQYFENSNNTTKQKVIIWG